MMRLTTSRHPRAWLALLALAGCNQLERVKDSDSGGGGGMPPEVRAAFEGSCGKVGCHVSGGPAPVLVGGSLDELVGTRYVTIGDIPKSYLAVKMLPDQTLEALGLKRESGGRMPLDQDFLNPNNQVILAWIAGAEFADSEGDPSTGDPSTGDTETTGAAAPTFTNVQAIFDLACITCHTSPPNPASNGNLSLLPMDSYASLVGKKASGLPSMDLVTPMDPSNSYLYLKLTGEFEAAGGTGSRMPFGAPLSDDQLLLIEEWINAGALDD